VAYEVVIQKQGSGEFITETVKSLGRGKNEIKKGDIQTREVTVTETWQVIRITEVEEVVEEAEVEQEVALDGLSEQEQPR